MSGNRVSSAGQPSGAVDPPDTLVATAAQVILKFGRDGGRGLLEEHTSDPSGHCRACYSSAGMSPVWPCTLWTITRHAQALHRARGGAS
ncbi:MAG: hypothetical protein H0V92_03090 [Pseudonocardiales bacterium]|nr:hypothetical protein [Pseudonocardiales bacterium]